MSMHVRVGGTWRTVTGLHVRVGGVWRSCSEGHVRVGGVWQQFFGGGDTLALPTSIGSTGFDPSSPFDARAGVKVDTDGYMYRLINNGTWSQVSGSQYWIDNKSATMSDYECKMEGTGSTPNLYGLSLSTWYTLSIDRAWGIQRTIAGTSSFAGTLYIREIADTGNQVTCTISLTADAGTL